MFMVSRVIGSLYVVGVLYLWIRTLAMVVFEHQGGKKTLERFLYAALWPLALMSSEGRHDLANLYWGS